MSFGTGQHETTRLVSRLMEKYVQPNQFWIDAGTGTGVLAILAVKLGAKSCYAFDNDIWSVENTLENIALNNVEDKIEVEQVEIDNIELPRADGIVANLFANLIIKNAPKFAKALPSSAPLLVSGILVYDKDEVISAAENAGFRFAEIIQEAEWVAIAFEKV
jgi:ribosomal protein L11 methyltransferase